MRSEKNINSPVLYGLNRDKVYTFTDPYTGVSFDRDGSSLMTAGISFELAPNTAGLCHFREKSRG